MKILSTVIVTATLAFGLVANSVAAPGHSNNGYWKQAQQHKKHQNKHRAHKVPKRVVKHKRVHKAPAKRIVKKIIKQQIIGHTNHALRHVYRVRPGDTLARIAARNHISLQRLLKINNIRGGHRAHRLRPGQHIRIR